MKQFITALKAIVGGLCLLAWTLLTYLFFAAQFGSYFVPFGFKGGLYLAPLLTIGRHLLLSLRKSYAPTIGTVVIGCVADILLTIGIILSLTGMALGPLRDDNYLIEGLALVVASLGLHLFTHFKMRKA